MKKSTLIITLALFVSFVGMMSCGDGGAADEARQQAIKDSLRNDSIQQAELAQHLADSLAQDSLMQLVESQEDASDRGSGHSHTSNGGHDHGTDAGEDKTDETKPEPKDDGPKGKTDRDRDGKNTDKVEKSDRDRGGVNKVEEEGKKTKGDRKRGR